MSKVSPKDPDPNDQPAPQPAPTKAGEPPAKEGEPPANEGKSPKRRGKKAKAPKKKQMPTTRIDEVGRGALKVLHAEEPDKSRVQILRETLTEKVQKRAYLPAKQMRKVCRDDLLILAGMLTEADESLSKTYKNFIKAKFDPREKAGLLTQVSMDINQIAQVRVTICRMAGVPLTANYDIDAAELIEELTEKMATAKEMDQHRYKTGIEMLNVFTAAPEIAEDPPMLTDLTDPSKLPTPD